MCKNINRKTVGVASRLLLIDKYYKTVQLARYACPYKVINALNILIYD